MDKMSRVYSRQNGWMPPPHPLQLISWLIVIYLLVVTYGVVIPAFGYETVRISLYAIMTAVILFNLTTNIIVTTIDPADEAVMKKIRNNPRPGFDRQKHRHVIDENYFCNICEIIINPTSKHCRQCNKCVLDFDHHCKWLNNCIGAKNYRWFFTYVISTVLASLSVFALCVAVFVLEFAQRTALHTENGSLTVFGLCLNDSVWLAVVGSTMVVAAIAAVLVVQLLSFHIRIVRKGTTTYNYIMDQRQKEETEKQRKVAVSNTPRPRLFDRSGAKSSPSQSSQQSKTASNNVPQAPSSRRALLKLKRLLSFRRSVRSAENSTTQVNFALKSAPANQSRERSSDKPEVVEDIPFSIATNGSASVDRMENEKSSDSRRLKTQLPQIQAPTASKRNTAISSFRNPEIFNRTDSLPSADSTLYVHPDDAENRLSVSSIMAAMPPEPNGRERGIYSRHTGSVRLPPLNTGSNSVSVQRPINSGTARGNATASTRIHQMPPHSDLMLYNHTLNNIRASEANTNDDEALREIPVDKRPNRLSASSQQNQTSSRSSSGSSGSSLTPIALDTDFVAERSNHHPSPGLYVAGGGYASRQLQSIPVSKAQPTNRLAGMFGRTQSSNQSKGSRASSAATNAVVSPTSTSNVAFANAKKVRFHDHSSSRHLP